MISSKFENLIIQEKASFKIWNLFNGVSNYQVGQGKICIIESIQLHPMQQEIFFVGEIPNINTIISDLYKNAGVFTMSLYDNGNRYEYTFKNQFQISTAQNGDERTIITISQLSTIKDVFMVFRGDNITVEISQNSTLLNLIDRNFGSAPYKDKVFNPNGFNEPIQTRENFTTFSLKPQGNLTDPTAGISYNDFIIPKIGDETTGNTLFKDPNNDTRPITIPCINLGIIEFKKCDYENI